MGYVYCIAIEGTNDRKIGITEKTVAARLSQLQTGNPYVLITDFILGCPNPSQIESILHHALDKYHINREWFRITLDELITYIAALILLYPEVEIIESEKTQKKPIANSNPLRKARNMQDFINLVQLSIKLGMGKEESLKIILDTYKGGGNKKWMTGIKLYDKVKNRMSTTKGSNIPS